MAKFSQVAAGTRERKPVKLPLPGAQFDVEKNEWVGRTDLLDIRALHEEEHLDVLAGALAFARKRGLEGPEDGDPLYEHGKMVYTLAIACVDPDSPKDAPAPYFDGGVEQILKSEIMTPEVVAHLYLQQQLWQDEVSPLKKDLTPAEFLAAAITTAKGNMSFFVNSRPETLWSFTRTLASLHAASLARNSASSSSSGPQATKSE